MAYKINKSVYILFIASFIACNHEDIHQPNSDLESVKEILKREREAHFTKDVKLFMSSFKDTAIMVNKGMVTPFIKNKDYVKFLSYFNSVDHFIKWDDLSEPILNFSADSTMAYAVVRKRVVLVEKFSLKTDTTDFAWLSVYRKINGKWFGECNVSTNK